MTTAPSSNGEPLVTASVVARWLGVSQSWVYMKADAGVLPHRRLGGDDGPVRFVPMEIRDWLEHQRRGWLPGRNGHSRGSDVS
jgi:predicted DNA-binding transcriptional regulator AlpA